MQYKSPVFYVYPSQSFIINPFLIQLVFQNVLTEKIAKNCSYQHDSVQNNQFFLCRVSCGFQYIGYNKKFKPEYNFIRKLFPNLLVTIRFLPNFTQDDL